MAKAKLGIGLIKFGNIPEATVGQLATKLDLAGAWNIEIYPGEITFVMYLGQDYKNLDDIKVYMLSEELEFVMSSDDYPALEPGYYFNSTDLEE